ncbi:hypothetical protein HYU22_02135 [Candidatus Woesearchaeota archaeon]|nr:hypothetical protein [Candidatus Woesearchaeota archaeon]
MSVGYEVWIMQGKKYYDNPKNGIYRAVASTTEKFAALSPALREFLSPFMKSTGEEPYSMKPLEYVPFIARFGEEKETLEQQGRIERGKDIGVNIITLYDAVEKMYRGLSRAQKLNAKVVVE